MSDFVEEDDIVVPDEIVSDDVLDSTEEDSGEESPQVESEAPESTEGRARDAHGKFAKAATPEGDAVTEDAEAGAQAEQVAPVVPSGRPVQLKADGQMYDLPGAVQRDDGVYELTPEGFDTVHRYVGQAIVAGRKIDKLQRELQETRETTSAESEYVKVLGERYAELAAMPLEELVDHLITFREQMPTLQAQMQAEHYRKQLERVQQGSRPDPAQQQQALQQGFSVSFDEEWGAALQQPYTQALSPEDREQLRQELIGVADSFLFVVPQDDPDRELRKGEWLFNEVKFHKQIEQRARYIGSLRQSSAKVASAAQRNVGAKVVAPPMGAQKKVSNSTSVPAPRAKTREEWQKQNLW